MPIATTAIVAVLALAACGRRDATDSRGGGTAQGTAATETAGGEIGLRALDTTRVLRGSADSTGRFGAPGYGFNTGGHFLPPPGPDATRP